MIQKSWAPVTRSAIGIRVGLGAAVLLSVGCRTPEKPETSPAAISESAAAGEGSLPPEPTTSGIVFIEDDYPRALAEAKTRGSLLFADAWATWCHTCLSMKEYVWNDPVLGPLKDRFVWLAIDTEKPENRDFLSKFPVKVWPTLWVIDPSREEATFRWLGSATGTELARLLEAASSPAAEKAPASPAPVSDRVNAEAAVIRGDREQSRGRSDAAIAQYEKALSLSPEDFGERGRVTEALTLELRLTKAESRCFEVASREWPRIAPGTSRLNVVLSGIECGALLQKNTKDPKQVDLSSLLTEAERIVATPEEPVLADDRSALYDTLVNHYSEVGEPERGRQLALDWSRFLEREAERAPTPKARQVFDAHRVLAYGRTGQLERARAMLERSERETPADYNAPARLAKVHLDLGQLDLALAAVNRALDRVYGPRALRLFALKADILIAQKQPQAAKQALDQGITVGEKLELSGGYARLLENLRERAKKP